MFLSSFTTKDMSTMNTLLEHKLQSKEIFLSDNTIIALYSELYFGAIYVLFCLGDFVFSMIFSSIHSNNPKATSTRYHTLIKQDPSLHLLQNCFDTNPMKKLPTIDRSHISISLCIFKTASTNMVLLLVISSKTPDAKTKKTNSNLIYRYKP